ncbi:threonine synthase [Actinoplanes cyaneus]|uniref:Threonine synthase n=1 Tax=Actinoplanes cyaneus TaxID=52696 RepID=A0A919IHX0_9ACTN|nr:pyridoxal-phosphate dependent enzyme [Actinoplanes cyaneus]MCW2140132.1 threonine synthase [Actinoplanes cyaneus]GID65446.1 threonine synthase [Actinoplanes cyaneus]
MGSLAIGQRSLGDPRIGFPLWPPLTDGCPRTSTADVAYPVDVDYDYERAGAELYPALLPPLPAPGLGEGRTPLVELEPGVFVKDESRNPTWSHKDRLNRCTVSAAVGVGAAGVVVASSGNHGASAAAYAARAGLPCVVITGPEPQPGVVAFLRAYGAVVMAVPWEGRWPLMRRIAERAGLHPVSSTTVTHTGHPFGPEGYKTIAYEIHADLGTPEAVFVPTGYGELLYGIAKGFTELRRLGRARRVPRMIACEPAAAAPLVKALREGVPAAHVEVGATDAGSIVSPVSGYRGVLAVRSSDGRALAVTDPQLRAAQAELARAGLWTELAGAAGLAGLRALGPVEGPVVCVATSSGLKNPVRDSAPAPAVVTDWAQAARILTASGHFQL